MKASRFIAVALLFLIPIDGATAEENGHTPPTVASDAADAEPAAEQNAPTGEPTAAEAEEFIAEFEEAYDRIGTNNSRVSWLRNTHITVDTNWLEALANAEAARMQLHYLKRAPRYDNVVLDPVQRRKLDRIKVNAWLLPPNEPDAPDELAKLVAGLDSRHATAKVPFKGDQLRMDDAEDAIGNLRDPGELESLWTAMRHSLPSMRADFARAIALSNEGARFLGYKDTGEMWRAGYDMPPDAFAALIERLWKQVEPLYRNMHCYTRARLNEAYGSAVQPRTGPIRNHLHVSKWRTISNILLPESEGPDIDLTRRLVEKGYDIPGMFKTAETFYTSLGFPELPKTFWERSMFTRPRDREVTCGANAWHIDTDDARVSGCFRVSSGDFYTAYHELGHIYYGLSTRDQDSLFADGANDGFHEAAGDFAVLSAQTQTYLQQVGLVEPTAPAESDIGQLMRILYSHGGAMPLYLSIAKWRWDVFAGKVGPEQYNDAWWQRRLQYLGIEPPSPRPADGFDPGASQVIAAFVPAIRYFLAEVYQFQFHRAACRIAGWTGPLHRCSVYGDKEVGARFQQMLSMGSSRPWPQALAAFTGETEADAGAMLEYFAPLDRWLTEQNKNETCGW